MQSVGTRGRLLAGAALGLGLAALAPQQALAACTYAGGDYTCTGTTTTTDTIEPANILNDRTKTFPAGPASNVGLVVVSGATVDGMGLALTTVGTVGPNLLATNNGTVRVSAGNTPTTGGSNGALSLVSAGTNIVYSGSGDIENLGIGDGLVLTTAGTGTITATIGGSVRADAGNAISATNTSATGGAISITTTAGETIRASGGDAINVDTIGTGSATVTNAATISSGGAGVNTLQDGIEVTSNGAPIIIVNTGAIGTATDRAQDDGIDAQNFNPASAGDISVTGSGAIFSVDDGILAETAGTGAVTVNYTGAINSTTGNGVDAGTAGGNLSVTTGSVTSTGNVAILADQTLAAGTGDISVAATGAVSGTVGIDATNVGLGGVTVTTGTGMVTGTAGSAIVAENTNVASADPILVTIGSGGATGTGASAVIATTAGTGTVTVNSSGPVTTNSGSGIFTSATTGATAINITGGSVTGAVDGIHAEATTGPITVTLTGGADVTGVGDDAIQVTSSGAKTVTIGAGSVVSGDYGVYGTGGGTLSVTNAGTLGLAGELAVLTTFDTRATVTNQAGGVINGSFDLSDLDDVVTNAGTLNLDGQQNFNLGVDLLTNQASGVINVAAGTTFNGLETLNNAGTITSTTGLTFDAGATALNNTGTINLTGALDLGAGTDTFANTGTGILNLTGNASVLGAETFTQTGRINLNTFALTGTGAFVNGAAGTIDTNGSASLLGFTSLSNAGTLDLAAGTLTVPAVVFTNSGTILADEGASTITGQTSFANSGTIDLQDGAVGDVLTINSPFVGSGNSNLLIDVNGTAGDRLVIGGAASGATTVNANFLGGGLLNSDGVLVVDATTATAGSFVLGTVGGDTPLVDFALEQVGGDFFLVSGLTAAAFNPLVVPGFSTDLWYQSANEVFAETSKPAATAGASLWGNVYYSRDRYGDNNDDLTVDGVEYDVNNRMKNRRRGVQLGVDYGYGGGGRVGLTGGYLWAKANGSSDADLKAKGWNLGLYGQFGGITGFHGEFLAKHDRYEAEFRDGVFDGTDFDIRSTGIDGSLGFRFGMGADGNVDVLAGLSHVRTKVDDIEGFGFTYDLGRMTSTRGRAGVRAVFGGGSLAPYVSAIAHHEFKGDGDITLFDGGDDFDLDTNGKGTWARIEAGLNGNDGPGPILAAWGDFGDRKGFGLRAGFRIGGAAVVAAPPPPPPMMEAAPPPPAPATQTCSDGSVILATDSCPLPPPPPPPAPVGERG